MLSSDQKKALLKLARDSISSEFSKEIVDLPNDPSFTAPRGVFVTLNINDELRGCIGFPLPLHSLSQAVLRAAHSAAFDDPRFPELKEKELEVVTIEISVLSVPEVIRVMNPVEYEDYIKIGRDGLLVKSMKGSGLLLPQVFTDYDCTPTEAIRMTCQKAGLSPDAWTDLAVKVYNFQAEVFNEKEFEEEED